MAKLLDHLLSRNQRTAAYWQGTVEHLVQQNRNLQKRIASLEFDVGEIKKNEDEWRQRYYDERRKHQETQHELLTGLGKLRINPPPDPDDIEDFYQHMLERSREDANSGVEAKIITSG